MNLKKYISMSVLILLASNALAVDVIDGNNPKYVSSIESLAKVVQLMTMAEQEMHKVYNLNALPGYSPSSELSRISDIKARANFILQPEKRRILSKPLILDGFYNTKSLNQLQTEKAE